MAQNSMKIVGWILGLLGLYGILSLLVTSIPAVLTGTWGWVVSIVLLIVGAWMAFK